MYSDLSDGKIPTKLKRAIFRRCIYTWESYISCLRSHNFSRHIILGVAEFANYKYNIYF